METTATAPGFSFVILWCSRRKDGRESLDRNVGSLFSKVRTPLRTILFFSIESCRLYTCRRRRQRGLGWLGGRAPPHFCPKTTLVMPTWFDDGRTDGPKPNPPSPRCPLFPSHSHSSSYLLCCRPPAATAVFFPSCLQPAGEAGCNLTQPGRCFSFPTGRGTKLFGEVHCKHMLCQITSAESRRLLNKQGLVDVCTPVPDYHCRMGENEKSFDGAASNRRPPKSKSVSERKSE